MACWTEVARRKVNIKNEYVRVMLAEALGTFVLVAFICGAVAQTVTSAAPYPTPKGTNNATEVITEVPKGLNIFLSIAFAHWVGVALGIFMCGNVSGGHVNPLVTVAMAFIGRLSWKKVPFYLIGQYVGAFISAAIVYGIYYRGLVAAGPEKAITVFGTFPIHDWTTPAMGFFDQFYNGMLLQLAVMAATDPKNMVPSKGLIPFIIAFSLLGIGTSFGTNGFAANPARDLGPRILTGIVYGNRPFEKGNALFTNYWWIPIIGCHLGGIVGALLYLFFVEFHHPVEEEKEMELTNNNMVVPIHEIQKPSAEFIASVN